MNKAAKHFILLLALVTGSAVAHAQTPAQVADAASLAGVHPAAYYKKAATIFQNGRKDDATFLFYLGQLRYRAHLGARNRELKPDGDPALFSSLSEVVGRPINEYAFGDLSALAKIIDTVIAYDQANPDTFTPPAQYAQVYANVRSGLAQMRGQLLSQADQIRKQRLQNGLVNRN